MGSMARGKIRMNHVFFAYDSVLFCKALMQKWAGLNQILYGYEQASRQQLNREKTSLFVSTKTKQSTRNYIMEIAGLRASSNLKKKNTWDCHLLLKG